jgi:hypothetical protein
MEADFLCCLNKRRKNNEIQNVFNDAITRKGTM